ncbi:MAG: ABC transporter ATP-binding protein [Christensenellales bacterium]|jgi:ATP-binding cassette subfamily B multidrug efflux pump
MKQSMGRKKKTPRRGVTIRRLFSYVAGRHRFWFILALFCIVVSALVGIVGSLFLRVLIDDFILPMLAMPSPSFLPLLQAVITMAGIYFVGVLATLFYNRFMVVVAQGILKNIRDDMFTHMQTLPLRYFDQYSHGDIMSHFTNDTDTLRQMITQSLPQLFSTVVTVVAAFIAMLALSLHLTLLVVVLVSMIFLIMRRIGGKSAAGFMRMQQALGAENGYIEEILNGQKVVKVFSRERQAKEDFDKYNDALCEHTTHANSYANILMPIMGNFGHFQYVMVAITGGVLAVGGIGGLTLGVIASFLQLSRSFTTPIGQASQQINAVVMALAGAQRIFELLDEQPEQDSGKVTLVNAVEEDGQIKESLHYTGMWAWKQPGEDGAAEYTQLKGDVRFADVDFGYEEGQLVLKDISLFAKPGQMIALVGATGAGKTTIANLINRFYDIDSGTIRYDGITIDRICKSDLRRSLGIVLQDTNLFTGTVLDNIRYGRLDATDEEVVEAARLAYADSFIRRLPDGYQTMLTSNGANLSQGQRQLLSIARAAVANPPVMILDEATSSIDTRTESLVQKGMNRLMKGRTVFVIAHRLSTVRDANAILVMEDGRIIERGDHETLIAQKGRYYQLYTGVFELE